MRHLHRLSWACGAVLFALTCACSTNAQKRDSWIIAASALGASIGAATAPSDERQDLHAAYWGAIFGVGTALIANHMYSDDDQIQQLQKDNQRLKGELDMIQAGNKILLDQGKGKFKNPVGETELGGQKAHWKIYDVNHWTKEGEDRLYHEDKMIEITPLSSGK